MNGANGAKNAITPGSAARAETPIDTIAPPAAANTGVNAPIAVTIAPPAFINVLTDVTNVPIPTTTGPIAAARAANLIMLSCWAVDKESHFCVKLSTTSSPF